MDDEEMEAVIVQTISGAIAAVPAYLRDVAGDSEALGVRDPKEFVYGMVMGMALGIGGAMLGARGEAPTQKEQEKMRDIVYRHIPEIREGIFGP